jgi:hypothetical protein
MDSKTIELSGASHEGKTAVAQPTAHQAVSQEAQGEPKLTYQVILRHLAKFRDGARALLSVFGEPAPATAAPPLSPEAGVPEPEPKSPLQLRIERHMGTVDRALEQIRDLNPEHRKKAELPPVFRDVIVEREQTIRNIVAAELHFWSASIQNSPLDKFDELEQAWIARIIRLAKILGVDADHKEHLDFLNDWAAYEHS